ncbi:hypothetical protein FKW77_008393 [Venturia effusa]|uniref:F-box domain-containing protein n=1 Tax=Venturia effusa TaxID=50376 RepID=A0A517KZZ2_9PEZI|nr:hypothetical protein FKW77_008393 [Venturia effusa]
MTIYLHELPIEFERAVCRYLDLESLFQFRLTSHHCQGVSVPAFRDHFRQVKATWSAEGVEKLLDISRSPIFRSSVKKIWIVAYDPRESSLVHQSKYDFDHHALGGTMLTLAIKNLLACNEVRISAARGASFTHPRIDGVTFGSNAGLTVYSVIQHAFNLCKRPLSTLDFQLFGEVEYIYALPSIQRTLTRLNLDLHDCRKFEGDDGLHPDSATCEFVLGMKALKWLLVKTSDTQSFVGFWSKAYFPSLETAHLYLGTDTTRLSAFPRFIMRHENLSHFVASVQHSIPIDVSKFVMYCYKQTQLETLWIDVKHRCGMVIKHFDCTDEYEIGEMVDFVDRQEEVQGLLKVDGADEFGGFKEEEDSD